MLPPYTFPTPSIELVLEALSARLAARVRRARGVLKRERARLSAALRDVPQVAAGLSERRELRAGADARRRKRSAKRRAAPDILVRTFDDPLLANCVRITVGRPADNDLLLRAVAGAERATDA